MKTQLLSSGASIPILGFGTWRLTGANAQRAVETALRIGYRYIDTADYYQNHREVAAALQASGIPREEIFLTTKVWHTDLHADDVRSAAHRFLKELRTPYVDLLLIHWPNCLIPLEETLTAFRQLQDEGITRSIGVSNFTIKHLQDVLKTGIPIQNNQVEFHPTLRQNDLLAFCKQHKIAVTAYAPLGRTSDLEHLVIQNIATSVGRPPSQIVLSWLLHKGLIAIPKATSEEHIATNFGALTLQLSNTDIERIETLEPSTNRLVQTDFAEFS